MSFTRLTRWRAVVCGMLTLLWSGVAQTHAADSLRWQGEHVAAEIVSWDLDKLLQKLVDATGWEIYLEPDTTRTVSVKFNDRPQGEALKMLFGDLNFALLPAKGH